MSSDAAMNGYLAWIVQTLNAYPGVIIQTRCINAKNWRRGLLCRGIRFMLGSWANHTAIGGNVDGHTVVGDATYPKAKWTPIQELLEEIAAGHTEARFYIPHDYDYDQGRAALYFWNENIKNSPYDTRAIRQYLFVGVRTLLKQLRADKVTKAVGWEWAWFCTEGVADSEDRAYGRMVFGKHPSKSTPLTGEHRVADGSWIELRPQQCSQSEPIQGAHPCASLPFVAPAYC